MLASRWTVDRLQGTQILGKRALSDDAVLTCCVVDRVLVSFATSGSLHHSRTRESCVPDMPTPTKARRVRVVVQEDGPVTVEL